MTITQDKLSTNLVKKFLKKKGTLIMKEEWHGFGEVSIRIVSVGETDKYNWNEQKYSRVLNIEVTMKKTGFHFSEDKIPSKYSWRGTQMNFYKRRKRAASVYFDRMINQTQIPLFFKMAGIACPRHNSDFMGKLTFNYID